MVGLKALMLILLLFIIMNIVQSKYHPIPSPTEDDIIFIPLPVKTEFRDNFGEF